MSTNNKSNQISEINDDFENRKLVEDKEDIRDFEMRKDEPSITFDKLLESFTTILGNNMPHKFFTEKRPHNGFTYDDYSEKLKSYIENTDTKNLDEHELELYNFTKLNVYRSNRAFKTYKPSAEIIEAVKKIESEQIWMVLTEGWCGDSAQTLPYIYMMIKENPNIKLRILLRDANLDIMDKYLVNGKSRSIPRLVIFNSVGNELTIWGPRPKKAQQIVDDLKEAGKDIHSIHENLHLWYGRNRGKSIEIEFVEIINSFIF